jgi:hypothetical protein
MRIFFLAALAAAQVSFAPSASGANDALAQAESTTARQAQTSTNPQPLPDIPALLRDVAKNQNALEELRKLYTAHLAEEQDKVDSNGNVKSRETREYDVFYVGAEEVRHLLAKDGKPLEGDQKRDEDDKFSKEFDKQKKKQAELAADPKKQAKEEEEDEAQLSDFLRSELFTNPRRTTLNGEDVIAFDVAANPNYKAKKEVDRIIQKLVGTMWVDEQAREIARLEAHFAESAHVGGGVLGSVAKGSSFVFEQQKINAEVWLPSYIEVHVAGRILIVKLKQNFIDRYSDYKKFRSGGAVIGTLGPPPNN